MRVAASAAVFLVSLQPAALAAEPSIAGGRDLLAANCGVCHAVGGSGESPNPEAPPFREVMKRYTADDLEESLAEGIVTGHPDMPVFELDPDAIADVVAYLGALAVVTEGE
jgi:mono/diheme cytochrome c family protein